MLELKLSVVQGSAAMASATTIVSPSTTVGGFFERASKEILVACGPSIEAELANCIVDAGGIELGQVVFTHAGHHPHARHVAHVAIQDIRPGMPQFPSQSCLREACDKLWMGIEAVPSSGPQIVAMPLLGIGSLVGPNAATAAGIIRDSLADHLSRIGTSRIASVSVNVYTEAHFASTNSAFAVRPLSGIDTRKTILLVSGFRSKFQKRDGTWLLSHPLIL